MSQERTEQRDWVKDWEMIEEIEAREIDQRYAGNTYALGSWVSESEMEAVEALRYYIELSEQRREERDSNQQLHIQSLEEIDRLNAVNAELKAKVQERDETINNLKWQIQVAKRAAKIDYEERYKEIERLTCEKNEWISKARAESGISLKSAEENAELREEIERLRAEMQSSADDLRELMEVAYRDCPYEAQKIADRLVATLKGAE